MEKEKRMRSTKQVGRALRDLRRERNILQREVARRLGKSQSHISYVESGARSLSAAELAKVARYLGSSADEILYGPGR